jgi:hypothetical protein
MAKNALDVNDPKYIPIMKQVYDNCINAENINLNDKLDIEIVESTDKVLEYNFLKALTKLDDKSKALVLNTIGRFCQAANWKALTTVSRALDQVAHSEYAGEILMGVFLAYEAIKSIREWWNGKITGERCAKQIFDSIASALGGAGGGFIGMSVGASLGPFGLVAGSLIGGFFGANLAGNFSNWISRQLFDLPKDKALENAFKFMGLNHRATNQEINKRFRELCLKYHPDKGGSNDQFHQLQCCMAIIRISKDKVS